ncbi:MAG: alpha/beta hydrolase [Chitinophagales bacterium]|nr:MAG: alpha/beta hydrolase [Chitinophagales bacterium]
MQLHYKSFGQGTPVIILHGLFGSLDNWQTFSRKLATAFHVIAVDLRNHGKSPHSQVHSYPEMADDLLEFFETHNLTRAHMIGHSMGGKAAMTFALKYPERLIKLVVVDISPRVYPDRHEHILRALSSLHPSDLKTREEADTLLAKYIPQQEVRQFLLKNLDRMPEGGFRWKFNLHALLANYSNINAPVRADVPVDVDTLVIRGGRSDYVDEARDLPLFEQLFKRVQIITIPEAGHWVHAEAPEKLLLAVQTFLGSS